MGHVQTGSFPHDHLSPAINRGVVFSEIEGGVYLADLRPGASLEVETQHHRYSVVNAGDGKAIISGHPDYCPNPVEVQIFGSNWGGSLLKAGFIGRGMRLEFRHPTHDQVMTSKIRAIRQVS